MIEDEIYGLVEVEQETIAYYREMIEEGGTKEELERFQNQIRESEKRIAELMAKLR